MVSHGDFVCHPRPCERYNHGTVVEFYCDPGYSLTSDYKYITCQYGEWFPSYQVYCIKSGKSEGLALDNDGPSLDHLHIVGGGYVPSCLSPPTPSVRNRILKHIIAGRWGCCWALCQMLIGPVQRVGVKSINLSAGGPSMEARGLGTLFRGSGVLTCHSQVKMLTL